MPGTLDSYDFVTHKVISEIWRQILSNLPWILLFPFSVSVRSARERRNMEKEICVESLLVYGKREIMWLETFILVMFSLKFSPKHIFHLLYGL